MRATIALAMFCLSFGIAHARDKNATCETDTSLRSLAADPNSFVGTKVIIPRMHCVDPGGAAFVCVGEAGGQVVQIRASALGRWTSDEIAELLIGDCKGTANLSSDQCIFRVAINASSASKQLRQTRTGSINVAEFVAPQIEFYEPVDRCR